MPDHPIESAGSFSASLKVFLHQDLKAIQLTPKTQFSIQAALAGRSEVRGGDTAQPETGFPGKSVETSVSLTSRDPTGPLNAAKHTHINTPLTGAD